MVKFDGKMFQSLRSELANALLDAGFKEPTDIQSASLPHLMRGGDAVLRARTGSGKTAAYLLPIMNSVEGRVGEVLVLAPTRELIRQIADQFDAFNKYLGYGKVLVYGGVGYQGQERGLRSAAFIFATPGRMLDMVRRGSVDLGRVKFLVIDEVDRMLDMGFIDDVKTILSLSANRRQTIMASATVPPEVKSLITSFMPGAKFIGVGDEYDVPQIEQVVYVVSGDWDEKMDLVVKEINGKTIIFTNTRKRADALHRQLRRRLSGVFYTHGGVDQRVRERVMDEFRERGKVLIATDLVSRGIDILDVNTIINFDVPQDPETYIHRIGRTARLNRGGRAVTLATDDDVDVVIRAAQMTKTRPVINRISHGGPRVMRAKSREWG